MKTPKHLLCASLLALSPLCHAQLLIDDPDVGMGPYTRHVSVATTRTTETLVATVVGDDSNYWRPSDSLIVGIYNSNTNRVDPLWQGEIGGAQINEIAIAAAGGWGGTAYPDRIYVAIEEFQDILRIPYSEPNRESWRSVSVLEFDYQPGATAMRDPMVNKVRDVQTNGRLAFNSRLHLELDLVGGPGTRYVPAVTFAWPDGGEEIIVATPFTSRGDDRVRRMSSPIAEEVIAGAGGTVVNSSARFRHASLAVDENADGVWIAFEQYRSDKVHVGFVRRSDFLAGKEFRLDQTFEDPPTARSYGFARPEIAANNNDVVLTCVRGPEERNTGARELVSFLKLGANPFRFHLTIHQAALGSGAVIMNEQGVRAAAWCVLDVGPVNPPTGIVAFTFRAQQVQSGLQPLLISDQKVAHCWRVALAPIDQFDHAVFAYSQLDSWATQGFSPLQAYLEPSR